MGATGRTSAHGTSSFGAGSAATTTHARADERRAERGAAPAEARGCRPERVEHVRSEGPGGADAQAFCPCSPSTRDGISRPPRSVGRGLVSARTGRGESTHRFTRPGRPVGAEPQLRRPGRGGKSDAARPLAPAGSLTRGRAVAVATPSKPEGQALVCLRVASPRVHFGTRSAFRSTRKALEITTLATKVTHVSNWGCLRPRNPS